MLTVDMKKFRNPVRPLPGPQSGAVVPRVFLIGASGVGKTTLARWVSETYRVPLMESQSRRVLAQMAVLAAGRTPQPDDEKLDAMFRQYKIFQAMMSDFQDGRLRSHLKSEDLGEQAIEFSFVSDRSIEVAAYTRIVAHSYGYDAGVADVMAGAFAPHYHSKDAFVIWVRPHRDVVACARAEGRRAEFLTDEMVLSVDDCIARDLAAIRMPRHRVLQVGAPRHDTRTAAVAAFFHARGLLPAAAEYRTSPEFP